MSNVAIFNPSKAPAFARKGELSDLAKTLAGGAGGKRISIRGGVFRLVSSGKEVARIEDRSLNIVLVKAAPKINRVFYLKSYDSDDVGAPDCWSADGVKPSPDSKKQQHTQCEGCPQNIAGSGQGNSRACRYQQRLAVVLESDIGGDVMQLALPAKSIFGKAEGDNRPLQEYARWLVAQNVNPETVVTQLRFDTESESPKLFFKAVRWLTDAEYELVETQANSDDAQKAITMTVAKMDGVAEEPVALAGTPPQKAKAPKAPVVVEEDADDAEEEAPAPAPAAKPARKAKPAPVVEVQAVEEAEEVEDPEVRKDVAKKPVVSAPATLADLVSNWDDE
jgi:hypothetical protein